MITVRRADDRGHADFGWLNTYHTFSFGRYIDRNHMGFRVLRVINEDWVQGGQGFPTHPHDNMEIITYVLEGSLEHRDSMGTGSVIRAGDVQHMSAGSGITHSEFNHDAEKPVHLYQIWLLPKERDIEPHYDQRTIAERDKQNTLLLLASPDGAAESIAINQDARLYLTALDGSTVSHKLQPGRHAWVQVTKGTLNVNGERVRAGDGVPLSDESEVNLASDEQAEVLLFDLP